MTTFRKVSRGIAIGGSGALAVLAGTTDVYAAETIAEIIVTAQKRSEALIDVPQSVTAIDGSVLERQQASSFQDYLKLVPGLQLTQDTPGVGRLVMRGVNTGGVASTVGVYVDETPFGSSSGLVNGAILAADFDTFDMQRVEVLRGPQGTLYGASSLGGVLKFVTNPPQTERVEARVRVGAETVEDGDVGYSGVGMVNVPLSESFAVRAVGYYRELGGFIDSIGTAGSDIADDINESESYGGRVSALYSPSDAFSLRLTAIMQNIRTQASSTAESNANTLDTLYGRLSQSQFVPEHTNVDYRLYNATLDFDLGFATLTSSTSYNEFDSPFRSDLTTQYSPLVAAITELDNELLQDQTTAYDKVTQEFRLASPDSDAFEWLVGAYYTREKGDILQFIEAVIPGTVDPIPGQPLLGDISLHSEYKEIAGFVSGTIHFGDRFDLTLGGRYSENDQEAKQDGAGLFVGPTPVSYPTAKSSEDVFTYSVAPKLKFGEHASLYARVASSFRPGGPNVLPPNAPPTVPLTYDSDSLTSYEVGFKIESADRVLGLDISAFHIDWEDIQLFARVNNFGVNINGGDATSDGLEFTARALLGDGFNVSLNGAYTDAQLEDDTPALSGGLKGDALPYTPEWSLGLNADYEWSVGSQATAYVGGALRYLSDQTATYDLAYRNANGRQREISSYEVLDLQAGIDFGNYSIELYAKNVTDSDGRTSVGGLGAYPNGAIGTGVIRPRTIGLTFGVDF
ncbi:MAG TPA: TonB-dependent receptor [Povalibacter sp.]|uniref:TonB-dependent receptor n=1 Tax=Povalibacter sp. TaxID=1962978 RepID=UPI002CBA56C3|nr:TonB-dependent receptor [Povalibacter sp.]HMN46488.1 TonB-dependent receptor [Povalibacter sp.]